MSCDNSIPVDSIVDQIREELDKEYIRVDKPEMTDAVLDTPVLNSPSIRGDLLIDKPAREALRRAVGNLPTQPAEIVGSRSDGSAFASLLQALATEGYIIDSTTT